MQFLHNSLVELITQTATNLPPDVRAATASANVNEASIPRRLRRP